MRKEIVRPLIYLLRQGQKGMVGRGCMSSQGQAAWIWGCQRRGGCNEGRFQENGKSLAVQIFLTLGGNHVGSIALPACLTLRGWGNGL
jgi:hypothetical protein